MEKGKRVDTPRKMGKVYKNKQHKTGFPRAVLQSSPTRGMWIETVRMDAVCFPRRVIPHTGDVD